MRNCWIVVLCLALPLPSWAVDGVLELNQAKVTGFPIQLNQRGAYVLTSNLLVPNLLTSAIVINVDDVTIDLNGFTIDGPNTCTGSGSTLACGPSTSGAGITTGLTNRITIRNGFIREFGGSGISAQFSQGVHIEDVTVAHNRFFGIDAGTDSLISGVTAIANDGGGIRGVGGSVIRGSTASENGDRGFEVVVASIHESTATSNALEGILVDGGTVESCNVTGNEGAGILAQGTESNLVGNVVRANQGNGVTASSDTRLEGNLIAENQGNGIFPGTGTTHHLLGNSILANSLAGVANPASGGVTLIGGGNRIAGNTPDLGTLVFLIDLTCNRIGTTTTCPP